MGKLRLPSGGWAAQGVQQRQGAEGTRRQNVGRGTSTSKEGVGEAGKETAALAGAVRRELCPRGRSIFRQNVVQPTASGIRGHVSGIEVRTEPG